MGDTTSVCHPWLIWCLCDSVSLPRSAGHSTKNEDMRGEAAHVELRRQLHCAAYNALIAVISCVQTDVKFYNGFLFSDDIAKVCTAHVKILCVRKYLSSRTAKNAFDVYRITRTHSHYSS